MIRGFIKSYFQPISELSFVVLLTIVDCPGFAECS